MKFLFITRLYSGFEPSLKSLIWKPEGVPTIYKLLNQAVNKYDTSIIFTAKDSGATYTSNWTHRNDVDIKLKNFSANVKVLTGIFYFPKFFPRKFAMILRDFRQLLKVIFYILKNRPDLVYCDSANVVIAFILTKAFPTKPIVVRVLGVCSFWRAILNSNRLVHKIYKFSFKGKFACVIGTQDGSGIEYWFEEVLKKNVPRYVLLNGVATNKPSYVINKRKNILFVGRLEQYKGILVFVSAMIKVLKEYHGNLNVTIIGDGTLYNKAYSICKKSGFLNNFAFLKSIPHSEVFKYYTSSDIYISANTDGNLINTNLEAISSNSCMLIPNFQKKKFIDIMTNKLLKDAVLYYQVNNIEDLSNKVMFLLKYPDKIIEFKKKLSKVKKSFIRTWKERVKEETIILSKIVDKNLKR